MAPVCVMLVSLNSGLGDGSSSPMTLEPTVLECPQMLPPFWGPQCCSPTHPSMGLSPQWDLFCPLDSQQCPRVMGPGPGRQFQPVCFENLQAPPVLLLQSMLPTPCLHPRMGTCAVLSRGAQGSPVLPVRVPDPGSDRWSIVSLLCPPHWGCFTQVLLLPPSRWGLSLLALFWEKQGRKKRVTERAPDTRLLLPLPALITLNTACQHSIQQGGTHFISQLGITAWHLTGLLTWIVRQKGVLEQSVCTNNWLSGAYIVWSGRYFFKNKIFLIVLSHKYLWLCSHVFF